MADQHALEHLTHLASQQNNVACQFAARKILEFARHLGVSEFVTIEHAHLVGGYWSGDYNIKLLNLLVDSGGQCKVATTISASSACINIPKISDCEQKHQAKQVVDLLVGLGAKPILTCAPYQEITLPQANSCIAWAESNAVVYANSVLNLKTNKTPQYMDLFAAICGYMPKWGLYLEHKRQPQIKVCIDSHHPWSDSDYQIFGLWLGSQCGSAIPIIYAEHLTPSKDQLRAVGANSSTTGNVPMFHWHKVTNGYSEKDIIALPEITYNQQISEDYRQQYIGGAQPATQVRVGTPHASFTEAVRFISEFIKVGKAAILPCYLSLSHTCMQQVINKFGKSTIQNYNINLVTDTCTYYAGPLPLPEKSEIIATNSGKWAYYARINFKIDTFITDIEQCARIAMQV